MLLDLAVGFFMQTDKITVKLSKTPSLEGHTE